MDAGRATARIDLALGLLAGLLLFLIAISPASPQGLTSLNQVGDTPCPAHLPIYGSALNASNHAVPSCFPQLTNGSVLFAGTVAGATGGITQDNANLFWDSTNHRLGIGTVGPSTALDVNGDITDRNVTSCGVGKALRTDANGKLICQALSCTVGAQTCSCSCTDSTNHACLACSCSVGAASCTVN